MSLEIVKICNKRKSTEKNTNKCLENFQHQASGQA